jgi:O-methyltransferase domain/Dimerisation domain
MTEHDDPTTFALPRAAQLIQIASASWVAPMLYAAAKLGIADHLAAGPRTAAELAATTKTDPPTLYRFLRTLAGLGILTERAEQRFALTPLGAALATDAPGSARATLLAFCSPALWRSWEEIVYALETGKTGFEKVNGLPLFDYLAQHPDEASHFSQAMVGFHGGEPATVAKAYDFSRFGTVVDVGGATGNMLSAILSHHPQPRGVLFDRPHVVRDAPALLAARGVAERVRIEPGDFFARVPAGGDAYVLSHIIHDWNEAQCLTILGHCRRAMQPDARLLIVETVLPTGDTPHQGKIQDMVMLVIPGGQERTEAEYADLLGKGGFRQTRVVPTESVVSIVEAVPA